MPTHFHDNKLAKPRSGHCCQSSFVSVLLMEIVVRRQKDSRWELYQTGDFQLGVLQRSRSCKLDTPGDSVYVWLGLCRPNLITRMDTAPLKCISIIVGPRGTGALDAARAEVTTAITCVISKMVHRPDLLFHRSSLSISHLFLTCDSVAASRSIPWLVSLGHQPAPSTIDHRLSMSASSSSTA